MQREYMDYNYYNVGFNKIEPYYCDGDHPDEKIACHNVLCIVLTVSSGLMMFSDINIVYILCFSFVIILDLKIKKIIPRTLSFLVIGYQRSEYQGIYKADLSLLSVKELNNFAMQCARRKDDSTLSIVDLALSLKEKRSNYRAIKGCTE